MAYAIEAHGLSKSYGHVHAVRDLDLLLGPGEIYGFVGLNGAGKTTTIRMMLGMIRPTAGVVQILGEPVGPGITKPWRRVGHMAGSTSAYPQLTVWENLEIARRLNGVEDAGSTARVIDLFALSSYAHRKAGALSTGNLQRLGLARAFIHDPALVILDEPVNGLDPAGVVEIRDLLRSLAHTGASVFMSSHILSEVDRLATRIGIIHNGRLIEELDSSGLDRLRAPRLQVQARDPELASRTLRGAGFTVVLSDSMLLIPDQRAVESPEQIATLMVRAGAPPFRLTVQQEDLESHFLRLTAEQP